EQTIFDVKGDLDIKVFEETFNCLIEKYDIFRTAFVYNKLDTPKQVVLKSRKINVEVLDLQHMESDDVEDKLQELLKEDKIKGFDLEKDTLLRLTILAPSENRYKIVWSFHHIIMDGWCIGLLLKDIVSIYEKLISNKRVENVQGYNYGQYIKWLQKQDLNTALDSWKEYLKDFDKASILIENANKNDGYEHKECKIDLNLSHLQKVRELTRKYGITESTFFQTVWGILLQKFNNTEDAIFGTVVSGRTANLPHIEDIIGLFINTLPLRVKGDSSLSFIQLAKNVQDKFNDVRKYEYTPLTSIQKVSEENQNLINSLFVYENYPISDLLSELKRENKLGFIIENIHSIEQTSYDFNIIINPNNEMPVEFKYNENIYSQEIVAVISETLIKIISQVTENVDILLKDIEIVPQSMIENIDRHMNFENSNYPTDICISELFEKMVEKFPTRIATIYGEDEITYEELNRRANKVARKLRQFNILNDEIVGIMLDRSIDMVVSIIGVLKAGGAYMPIDVDYPEDRKQYMVDDSKTRIIITEEKYLKEVQWDNDTIYLSRVIESNIDNTNIKCINSQSDLAYIIYTSGSSGKPKGTMIEHKNVIRLLFNSDFMFDFDENDVWTLAHSFCFDFSVWEMYGALLNGGKLVLLPKKVTISPERLVEVLEEQKVTVLNQTPVSFYGIIDEAIKRDSDISLKYVIFGGEALTPIKLKPWRSKYPETHLINMYGITETTVHVTYKEILEEDIDKNVSNIGKPIPTLSVYILDK
ncbi:MAG: non-ribosomal peptide synthetase, partial [Clostridium sp.]